MSALPSPAKGTAAVPPERERPALPVPPALRLAPPAATRASAAAALARSEAPATASAGPAAPAAPVLNPTRVRTDYRQMSLQSLLESQSASQAAQASQVATQALALVPSEPAGHGTPSEARMAAYEEAQQLTSIEELRQSVASVADEELSASLQKSVTWPKLQGMLCVLSCSCLGPSLSIEDACGAKLAEGLQHKPGEQYFYS